MPVVPAEGAGEVLNGALKRCLFAALRYEQGDKPAVRVEWVSA